jgi:type II secretory pathway pseudopilin PulG
MNIKKNQSGVASMVIVILIMTLLTLIVLSMTQNANREQRQALDRQLNGQAFFAAESAVSDLKDYIIQNPAAELDKNDCDPISADPDEYFPGKTSRVGDPQDNVRYTCVLYDQRPPVLKYSSVGTSTPLMIPIVDDNGEAITELTFKWTKKGGGTNFSGCPGAGGNFPGQLAASCEAGLLRVSLIDPSFNNRKDLANNTFHGYFKPTNGGAAGAVSYTNGINSVESQGSIGNAGCSAAGKCVMRITNIGKARLYLKMRSIYKINDVEITGRTTSGDARFIGAQAEVDATGRANDILKRISVRIGVGGLDGENLPGFSLQSTQDVCKQLQVIPPATISDAC